MGTQIGRDAARNEKDNRVRGEWGWRGGNNIKGRGLGRRGEEERGEDRGKVVVSAM